MISAEQVLKISLMNLGQGYVDLLNNQIWLNDFMNRKIRHCRIGKVTDKQEPRQIRLPDRKHEPA